MGFALSRRQSEWAFIYSGGDYLTSAYGLANLTHRKPLNQ